MLTLGISGGPFRTHEDGTVVAAHYFHDSAAVLLKDSAVVAAIETERLNRIKHSNKFPAESIRFCLDYCGIDLRNLDAVAYYFQENKLDTAVEDWNFYRIFRGEKFDEYDGAKSLIQDLLSREFNYELPADRIIFVNHHLAHASSAFFPSGFDESLVFTVDAQGDDESGRLLLGNRRGLETISSLPFSHTLGGLYLTIIKVLGFQMFEEYKVMGLAPYGDRGVYRKQFNKFYTLLPDGAYTLNWQEITTVQKLWKPRKKHEEMTSMHANIAAALQEMLEEIVLHVLRHFRQVTRQRNLCIAGGVGHNCSMNGRILASGLFDGVFVQPAAHDGGCAYGAALSVYHERTGGRVKRLRDIYWGRSIGDDDAVMAALTPWEPFIEVGKPRDICLATAALLAEGNVVGWVQGRSEFGPRALGNRSIIADPRPKENKQIINEMVKKREAFRPFAPSVLEEYAKEYFEVGDEDPNLAYMIFVVNVKPEKREMLGAVTHVDGTARIQTVSKKDNPKYWALINAFKEITGLPVLLNTSFNNDAEPIVDSVDDAVVCFLTTQINYLVVGNYLVTKKTVSSESWAASTISLPPHVVLSKTRCLNASAQPSTSYECKNNFDRSFAVAISGPMFEILMQSNGSATLSDLLKDNDISLPGGNSAFYDELRELWGRRLVILRPGPIVTRMRAT